MPLLTCRSRTFWTRLRPLDGAQARALAYGGRRQGGLCPSGLLEPERDDKTDKSSSELSFSDAIDAILFVYCFGIVCLVAMRSLGFFQNFYLFFKGGLPCREIYFQ